ncbi:protein CvgSY [Rodentibacter pneumotropicus]|uniref:Protein CvgSY n=1 Tax=Rodentibacter pneumotropicus TaxID=758 RepID=A0A3S4VEB9_9PAST|nr:protein CvgSY [Rodentibacter pneumotropicus]
MKNWITSTKIYSVRFRLMLFLITVISLIIAISMTAIIGLNNTYNSLSNLRDRSLNQMFSSMTLGVKTAQISTYAKRLTQTTSALEYQGESKSLTHHAEELQTYSSKPNNPLRNPMKFSLKLFIILIYLKKCTRFIIANP